MGVGVRPSGAPSRGSSLMPTGERWALFRCSFEKGHSRQRSRGSRLLPATRASPTQVVVLERRSDAGRVVYKALEGPWRGTEEDTFTLLDSLDRLRVDAAFLSSDAILPDLADELAPVSPLALPGGAREPHGAAEQSNWLAAGRTPGVDGWLGSRALRWAGAEPQSSWTPAGRARASGQNPGSQVGFRLPRLLNPPKSRLFLQRPASVPSGAAHLLLEGSSAGLPPPKATRPLCESSAPSLPPTPRVSAPLLTAPLPSLSPTPHPGQVFLLRWVYAATDYAADCWDSLFRSNWCVSRSVSVSCLGPPNSTGPLASGPPWLLSRGSPKPIIPSPQACEDWSRMAPRLAVPPPSCLQLPHCCTLLVAPSWDVLVLQGGWLRRGALCSC